MSKRAIALAAVLVTATLTPPEEATAAEPLGPPAPDLDEALVNLELPSKSVVEPPAAAAPVPAPPVPAPPVAAPSKASSSATKSGGRPAKARSGDPLARIRACESGSNYQARSASGRYRGAYQFDRVTFASVGGSGDPAAASPAEQDHRARLLLAQRGGSPWPVCSRRG
jgi:hypothetical protein